jgi:hypothetical protein
MTDTAFKSFTFPGLHYLLTGNLKGSVEFLDTTKQARARDILHRFLACQQINPYTGWNFDKLRVVCSEVITFVRDIHSEPYYSREMNCLMAIVIYGEGTKAGFVITNLNLIAAVVRECFGMPSVEMLNPDIKQMKEKAKSSAFFKSMAERFSHGIPASEMHMITAPSVDRKTQFKVVAVDNTALKPSNSVLPQAMLDAGEKFLAEHRNFPADSAREVAVELFRVMVEASPKFDANNFGAGEPGQLMKPLKE